ncbi:MAG: hypothetical protein AB7I42_24220 [Bradyrhizobium sp.]|uniref:hypothetical protein n=1 Tax=Bradyrhizobium sp. TaxID=376 RepID=UPI003D09E901
MLQCPIRPEDARAFPTNGWYAGTDAIQKGELFCMDLDYGTATAADPSRANRVVRPVATGAAYLRTVAGVAAQNQPANAAGQKIELLMPGSVCEIAILAAPTLGDRVTALAGSGAPGRFGPTGLSGRGSATVLRTIAAIASLTDYGHGCFSSSVDGSATLTISGTAYTVTKTAAFAYVPATANLQGNEYVYIVAGSTAADGTVVPTVGRYKITAKTSDDAVILDPAGTAPAASSVDIAFFCVRGNPTVLAILDGPLFPSPKDESGLIEYLSPDSGAAIECMIGGTTLIFGGVTVAADVTGTLANGTFVGQQKAIKLIAALTTSDYALTVTAGCVVDPTQASLTLGYSADTLAVLTFDQASEAVLLIWGGATWGLQAWSATAGLVT